MAKESKVTTDYLKQLLADKAGGLPLDWSRKSKKTVYGGDTERVFENAMTGEKISVYERADGLLYAELPNGSKLTHRQPWHGRYNKEARPDVVDVVMNEILEDADEINDAKFARAVKEGLVSRFSFTICEADYGNDEPDRFATIYPTVRDETFKCPDFIRPMAEGLDDTDECMVTEWRFANGIEKPGEMALHLLKLGFQWDVESQAREFNRDLNNKIAAELAGDVSADAAAQKGVALETDPIRNAIAEKAIRMTLNEEESADSDRYDVDFGVPEAMVRTAGKALANRFCFALAIDDPESGALSALITPIRFFKEKGHCNDQDGPVRDLLPDGFHNAMEATWHAPDDLSPLEVARELQKAGFVYNRDFQKYIDKCQDVPVLPLLTELDAPAAPKAAPAAKPKGPGR